MRKYHYILSMRHRPQAPTLVLQPCIVRSLSKRSWRTDCMARHRQESIRLPYTAPTASHRAFFVKELQAVRLCRGDKEREQSLSVRLMWAAL